MSNKVLYVIVAVLILLGIGFYVYNSRQTQAPAVENSQTSTTPSNSTADNNTPATNTAPQTQTPTSPANNGGTFSGEADIMGKVYEVDYTSSGFSPSTLTVKAGDTVVFKNKSSSAFWPASDPHPTHTDYPGFDAKQPIAA